MRPVPTVFLRLAFSDQLSVSIVSQCSSSAVSPHADRVGVVADIHFLVLAAGYPQPAQT